MAAATTCCVHHAWGSMKPRRGLCGLQINPHRIPHLIILFVPLLTTRHFMTMCVTFVGREYLFMELTYL